MRVLLVLLAMLVVAGCGNSHAAKKHVANPMTGTARSEGLVGFGTLCSGEFECSVAPLYTKIAYVSWQQVQALKSGQVSAADSQMMHDKVQKAHDLLDQARKACAQDGKSGKCTGGGSASFVAQAATILASF